MTVVWKKIIVKLITFPFVILGTPIAFLVGGIERILRIWIYFFNYGKEKKTGVL